MKVPESDNISFGFKRRVIVRSFGGWHKVDMEKGGEKMMSGYQQRSVDSSTTLTRLS
jgi:hypothetical protein